MGEFVLEPESSPSLPTPRSVVVGLLLATSPSAALGQVGSAVSLPGRILSPWESHRVRLKQTPHSHQPQFLLQIPLLLPGFQKGLLSLLAPTPSKIPFPEVCGGEAIGEEEEESQVWTGHLGIKILQCLGPGILWTYRDCHTPGV